MRWIKEDENLTILGDMNAVVGERKEENIVRKYGQGTEMRWLKLLDMKPGWCQQEKRRDWKHLDAMFKCYRRMLRIMGVLNNNYGGIIERLEIIISM